MRDNVFTNKSPNGTLVTIADVTTSNPIPVVVGGGAVVVTAGLTDFAVGVHVTPGNKTQVSIFAKPGSTGTIEGTAVVPGASYTYTAPEGGGTVAPINFEVTSGEFQVLTTGV